MKRLLFLIIVFGIFAFSCSREEVDPKLPKMEIDFSWPIDQKCFDTRSPEISIKKVPKETRSLSIILCDLSNRYDHGGGSINFQGKSIIPEGAVKGNYEGPCPPGWGTSPDYELTVKAIDEKGNILGIGKKVKTYPSEK